MRLAFLTAAALCTFAPLSYGDTISQSVNTGPFSTNGGAYQGQVVSVTGFNPNLGTLTSVGISYYGPYTETSTAMGPGGSGSALAVYLGTAIGRYPAFGGVQSQTEPGLGTYIFQASTSDSSTVALNYFSQSGTLNPVFNYTDGLYGAETSTGFIINLTYNYTAAAPVTPASMTPEPSSFALLGTGMLGVVGMLRKRFA